MTVRDAEEFHPTWARAFNGGNLDEILSLYAPGATLVAEPSRAVQGEEAIRAALAGLLALKPRLTLQPEHVLRSAEVALLYSRWRLRGVDPRGAPVELEGRTNDVVVRAPDGRWLIAVDNPWGQDGV